MRRSQSLSYLRKTALENDDPALPGRRPTDPVDPNADPAPSPAAASPTGEPTGNPADPAPVDPAPADPTDPVDPAAVPADPAPADPLPTDPAPTDIPPIDGVTDPTPAPADPLPPADPVDPAAPAGVDPQDPAAVIDPAPVDPAPADPAPADPAPVDPAVAVDPAPVDPRPADPAPADPAVPADPAPEDPIPGDPAPQPGEPTPAPVDPTNGDPTDPSPDDDEVPDTADSLETEMLEVTRLDGRDDEVERDLDVAEDAVEALESMALACEAALAVGGMDRHGARVMDIALEGYYHALGLGGEKSIPALETFGSLGGRADATKLALEDIKEKLVEGLKIIRDTILKAIKWIAEKLGALFDATEKMDARAKALAATAKKTMGAPKTGTLENDALATKLAIDTKLDGKYETQIRPLVAVANAVFGPALDVTVANGKKAADALKPGATTEATNAVVAKLELAPLALQGWTVNAGDVEGVSNFLSPVLPGNKTVLIAGPSKALKGDEAVAALRDIGGWLNPLVAKTVPKLATLRLDDAEKLAAGVSELAGIVRSHKSGFAAVQEVQKNLISTIDALIAAGSKEDLTSEEKAAFRARSSALRGLTRALMQPSSALAVYILNTGKAQLDYVELSLKNYAA